MRADVLPVCRCKTRATGVCVWPTNEMCCVVVTTGYVVVTTGYVVVTTCCVVVTTSQFPAIFWRPNPLRACVRACVVCFVTWTN